jgi:hypothetical protein
MPVLFVTWAWAGAGVRKPPKEETAAGRNRAWACGRPDCSRNSASKPDEIEAWLTAPAKDALTLQRPLPDDALEIVARGEKTDGQTSLV